MVVCLLVGWILFLQLLRFQIYLGPPYTYIAISTLFSAFCIWKIDSHQTMLEQMECFDWRDATCTLETDRIVIKKHIFTLFDEALEPPLSVALDAADVLGPEVGDREGTHLPLMGSSLDDHIRRITSYPTQEEVLEQFNAYVRGPLRDRVIALLGRPECMSFKLILVACLPAWFSGLVSVLGCDGQPDCATAANNLRFASVAEYTATNVVMTLFFWPIACVTPYPAMMWVNQRVSGMVTGFGPRLVVGSFLCTILSLLLFGLMSVLSAMFVVGVSTSSPSLLLGFATGFLLEYWVLWFLVLKKGSNDLTQRSLSRQA
ncbi:unnamed protein product [Durusdinium trenchii]|uniref:Uncharacterized protein n=1 Tax=Durusdinium trenchii TaxID=1381693 RepID=A0ABP0N3W6_9DINO